MSQRKNKQFMTKPEVMEEYRRRRDLKIATTEIAEAFDAKVKLGRLELIEKKGASILESTGGK